VHPLEGQKLPPLSQVFILGAVTPGSTVTINGSQIPVHPKGGYLAMAPAKPGEFIFSVEAKTPAGESLKVDRHVSIATGFVPLPASPLALDKNSIAPGDEEWLAAGDTIRVTCQGSPGAMAEFSIDGVVKHVPMIEWGTFPAKNNPVVSTSTTRGFYEGAYTLQPKDKANRAFIEVQLKSGKVVVKEKAPGKLTVDPSGISRVGTIIDDTVAARTGPDGGYDLFLYKGMRVRLTGKIGSQWRVGFSSIQSGWIKESAVQELSRGTPAAQSALTNFTITSQPDGTLIRIPLSEVLPYRTEQSLNPARLTLTFFGAVDKTDLVKHDPLDSLVRLVRWKQIAPDTCQLVIDTTLTKWWGYDVRYEGTALLVEIRKPWEARDLKGMVIAVDPGHGGSDTGATGPHSTFEKDAYLALAIVVKQALERAGAKPFLTREKDIDVALYERPRMAWNRNARLFVSVHCNASGEGENPLWNNGFSVYWYQPQSAEFARAIHANYLKQMTIPDHGLYFADLAVCRMTQMPAVLTEQAYIIVPEQEDLIFSPEFRKKVAASIVNGIKAFVAAP
jgi:N-acetylmuramoyl-L-alanine amidase